MTVRVNDVDKLRTWLPGLNPVCRLTKETKTKSPYEELFKKCLLELGIQASYEPFSMVVMGGYRREITYTPDFVAMNLRVNTRLLVLEPHMMYNRTGWELRAKLSGLKHFRSITNSMFYLVVASDIGEQMLKSRAEMDPSGSFDAYWTLPVINPWSSRGYHSAEEIVKQRLRVLELNPKTSTESLKCQARK